MPTWRVVFVGIESGIMTWLVLIWDIVDLGWGEEKGYRERKASRRKLLRYIGVFIIS